MTWSLAPCLPTNLRVLPKYYTLNPKFHHLTLVFWDTIYKLEITCSIIADCCITSMPRIMYIEAMQVTFTHQGYTEGLSLSLIDHSYPETLKCIDTYFTYKGWVMTNKSCQVQETTSDKLLTGNLQAPARKLRLEDVSMNCKCVKMNTNVK